MARVTVEDCVVRIPNRFELVMLAAQRARAVTAGAALTLDRDNDKNPVVALREIAAATVELSELENGLIKSLQKHVESDEPEEDNVDILAIQQEMTQQMAQGAPQEMPSSIDIGDDVASLDEGGDIMGADEMSDKDEGDDFSGSEKQE